jgi:peptidyl-prolyl cis-trans isomerase A (cyclophilin A)
MTRVLKALAFTLAAALVPAAAVAQKPSLSSPASLKEQAPATYKVKFDTSAGEFIVTVNRSQAPNGADRFYNLVKNGFYDGARFFRVVPGFMVQFGISGDPEIQKNWANANIQDDPVKGTNARGTITFATRGPNTRTSQVFINFGNNAGLDKQGFAPFGEVTTGMTVVDKINAEYRERPQQGRIQGEGNAYLNKEFPKLDFIKKATIEK